MEPETSLPYHRAGNTNHKSIPTRKRALGLALAVTFLWSTSWLLIKIGLRDVPAITFAGLRYFLAFLCLLPFVFRKGPRYEIRHLTTREWGILIGLGFLLYSITQGAQFLGLSLLPINTPSLLLNLSGAVVALAGMLFLGESLSRQQWLGVALNLLGVLVFFYPPEFSRSDIVGIGIVLLGMLANSVSTLISRRINGSWNLSPLVITTISMGVGSILLLIAGALVQGIPHLSLKVWAILIWMAVVNTAFGFTIWNYTQQTLLAMESTIINSTMLIQIAFLGWIGLGESLSVLKMIGMALVLTGVILAQLRREAKPVPNLQNGT